ncbi:alkaline phosphatase family protein [Undibacterium luofuense]|uniref:Alkaline phosphatase family protein n=1 Tax=Undibacterium luofuense TaxID=2828733 RepID=A0A941DIP3_9BURK|nr:ectonucleotide pyrophosphatase/phosphodiesterase [Undibacterium luofuense]MBR7780720.1 alkaline phosphatase family protein [Undibacterium luofuense]
MKSLFVLSRLPAMLASLALLSACSSLLPAAAPSASSASATTQKVTPANQPLILISIDGFRPDYLQRGVSPVLNQLAQQGASAAVMRPSFPSVTFPNHYTLVTGLRPDQHGIVANTMEDPQIPGVRFALSKREAVTDRRWWDMAEPFWVTAEKAGVKTGTMFWPGSEADIQGVRPSQWAVFDEKMTPATRVDTLLGWLDLPAEQRPRLLTLYFDQVDHAGHDFGPDSPQIAQAVAEVDAALGRLRAGLQQRGMQANLVIVSDHGMAAVSDQRVIRLNQLLPDNQFRTITTGPFAGIELTAETAAQAEKAILGKHEHMECWRKSEIPARLEFGSNRRVPAVFCLAEPGWQIVANEKAKLRSSGGAHGYDNLAPEMAALFIANGPAFRAGAQIAELQNVDVYPLLMQVAGVPALPSRGKLQATSSLLSDSAGQGR